MEVVVRDKNQALDQLDKVGAWRMGGARTAIKSVWGGSMRGKSELGAAGGLGLLPRWGGGGEETRTQRQGEPWP